MSWEREMSSTVSRTMPPPTGTPPPSSVRLGGRRPGLAPMVDGAFLVGLVALALVGFRTVFTGTAFAVAGAAGLAGGVLIGQVSAWRRLPVFFTAMLGVLGFAAFGLPAVTGSAVFSGDLPLAFANLCDGAVQGWRDVLTTIPPVPDDPTMLAVPFLCGYVPGLCGQAIAGRSRRAMLPVVAPLAALLAVILLGTSQPAALLLQGGGFALLALAWGAVRRNRFAGKDAKELTWSAPASRSGLAAGLLAAATASGVLLGPLVPLHDRFVLREHIVPPFDPSQYPSPLAGLRKFEVQHKDDVLFTVSGLPAGARIRLATMDAYDGVVFSVVAASSGRGDASGSFERVGKKIPTSAKGTEATITVTIRDFSEVWLPTVGAVTSVDFAGARARALSESFRFNAQTGVGIVPARLAAGDQYTMTVIVPAEPEPDALAGRSFGRVNLPELTGVPDEVVSLAAEYTREAGSDYDRLKALLTRLKQGAFSDGTDATGVRPRPGHGAARLREFVRAPELVGDYEQYAATLALMARGLGIPARVVLGVVPRDETQRDGEPAQFAGEVTGAMVQAWVEVYFDGLGWVAFDAAPSRDRQPHEPDPRPRPRNRGAVIQPPLVPPAPPGQLSPPTIHDECAPDDPNCEVALPPQLPWWLRVLLPAVGVPVLVVGVPPVLIVGLKWRRARRRRRTGPGSTRVAGAWAELVDRLGDLGVRTPANTNRREQAQAFGGGKLSKLAREVDAIVFGPGQPDQRQVAAVWAGVEQALAATRAGMPRRRRLRAMLAVSSFWSGRRPRKPGFRETVLAEITRLIHSRPA